MGVNDIALRALAFGKRLGLLDLKRTVTLGRQEIHFSQAEYDNMLAACPASLPLGKSFSGFAETLLQALGASVAESIDATHYEGASIIADFNEPLDPRHHGQFTCFIDFGSMEHVFDVRRVLLNLNNVLAPDGTVLIITNANGFVGHGFYQFSPELFYSGLSMRNGFADTMVFLIDRNRSHEWHYVRSPNILKSRNQAPYDRQFYVLCITKKIKNVDHIKAQQSDYETAWQQQGHKHAVPSERSRMKSLAFHFAPSLYEKLRVLFQKTRLRERRIRSRDRRIFEKQTVAFNPDRITSDELARMKASPEAP